MHIRPDQGNPAGKRRWQPPGGKLNLHSNYEEIPGGTKMSIDRQYDEIIIRPTILPYRKYISDHGNKTDSQSENTFGQPHRRKIIEKFRQRANHRKVQK